MKYKRARPDRSSRSDQRAGAMSTFIASGTSYATQMTATVLLHLLLHVRSNASGTSCGQPPTAAAAASSSVQPQAGPPNGEGLQHQDGHSLPIATSNPAVRLRSGLRRDGGHHQARHGGDARRRQGRHLLHHAYNETVMPAKAKDADEGILRGLHRIEADEAPHPLLDPAPPCRKPKLPRPAPRTRRRQGWSATSYGELRREAMEAEAQTRHPARSRGPVGSATSSTARCR